MNIGTEMSLVKNITPSAFRNEPTAKMMANRVGHKLKSMFNNHLPSNLSDEELVSRSIAAFSIYHFANETEDISAKSVCDGKNDGGIDALYISHQNKIVVIVQSKYNQSGSATWSKNEFLSFKASCTDLFNAKYERFSEKIKKTRIRYRSGFII